MSRSFSFILFVLMTVAIVGCESRIQPANPLQRGKSLFQSQIPLRLQRATLRINGWVSGLGPKELFLC